MVPLPEPGGGALVSYLRFLVFGRGRDKDIELERESSRSVPCFSYLVLPLSLPNEAAFAERV